MSIYVYAPVIQPGTRELIQALGARRLVRHDGLHYLYKGVPVEFSPKDQIVCWGTHPPPVPDVRCLNASLKYPTLRLLNTTGKQWLGTKGINVFYDQVGLTMKQWEENLPQKGWWPTKATNPRLVSFAQLPGYAVPYHPFDKTTIVRVFAGQFVDGVVTIDPIFPRVLEELQLDFAELYVAYHRNDMFVLFIDTAPVLDADGVKKYAGLISKWAGTSSVKTPDEI